MRTRLTLSPAQAGIAVLAAFSLAACSPQHAPQAGAVPQAGAAPRTGATTRAMANGPAPDAARLGKPNTACWLLPGDVVSKAIDETLRPVADLGAMQYGNTSCNYYAPGSDPDEDAPRLTVTLDWNGYNIIAMQIPKAAPATAAAPYADIGDGAMLEHGVLFVRAGRHSVAMDLRGDGDLHGIAARLMAAARPKLAQ